VRARARPPRARAPLHLRCPSLLAVLYYGVRDLTQRIHDRIPLIEWHRDALPFEFRACVVLEMRGELREERRGEHASVTHTDVGLYVRLYVG
jgi:hypothetical protein